MTEIISVLFSKLGLPGIVVFFLFYCIKNNPITSLSSSTIEMKLATKDKRFYIIFIKDVLFIFLYAIILTTTTVALFTNENLFSYVFWLIVTTISIGLLLWVAILDARGKTFSDLGSSWSTKRKWTLFIIFLINFMSLFVIIAYYMSNQLYPVLSEATDGERNSLYLGLLMLYFVIALAMHITVIDIYLRFLGIKNNNKFTLVVYVENEKWYLFHPIEKEIYLLGNSAILNECSKFSFIERKELLKEIIEVEN